MREHSGIGGLVLEITSGRARPELDVLVGVTVYPMGQVSAEPQEFRAATTAPSNRATAPIDRCAEGRRATMSAIGSFVSVRGN